MSDVKLVYKDIADAYGSDSIGGSMEFSEAERHLKKAEEALSNFRQAMKATGRYLSSAQAKGLRKRLLFLIKEVAYATDAIEKRVRND